MEIGLLLGMKKNAHSTVEAITCIWYKKVVDNPLYHVYQHGDFLVWRCKEKNEKRKKHSYSKSRRCVQNKQVQKKRSHSPLLRLIRKSFFMRFPFLYFPHVFLVFHFSLDFIFVLDCCGSIVTIDTHKKTAFYMRPHCTLHTRTSFIVFLSDARAKKNKPCCW